MINNHSNSNSNYKTIKNYAIAGTALGATVIANPKHHVEHAVIHGVLGPVISGTIIEPATKILSGNPAISHSHGHGHGHGRHNHTTEEEGQKNKNKLMNFVTEVYHGMMHHLITQIVFDQALRLWNGGKTPTSNHH